MRAILCFMTLFCLIFVKHFVNIILFFAEMTSFFPCTKMADVQDFLQVFREFLRINVTFGEIFN